MSLEKSPVCDMERALHQKLSIKELVVAMILVGS